ncbi:hypothetical protein BGZ60DRAFT_434617 [Tricladium varicosporioides]|nr:hypothetical protein BGZ60DRAFT_434617 [Hymenoscyphus varicosporioides]
MLYFSQLLSLLTLCSQGNSIALSNSPPTPTFTLDNGNSNAPEPTQAPSHQELELRQATTSPKILLAAPDNTCGYISGSSDHPWGCSLSSTCIFSTIPVPTTSPVPSLNTTYYSPQQSIPTQAGGVLCCDASRGCPAEPAPTACVDKGKFDYNATCTGGCPNDPATLKCTSGIYLYCATLSFPSPGINALYCDYVSTYPATPIIATTLSSFTPTTVEQFYTYLPPTSSRSSTKSGKTRPTSTVSTGPKVDAGLGGGKKGVIIGGVVGGIAALGLLVGLGVWLGRRGEKKEAMELKRKKLGGSSDSMNPAK